MPYNLTEAQCEVLSWLVTKKRSGEIEESFLYSIVSEGVLIHGAKEYLPYHPTIGAFDALVHANLLIKTPLKNTCRYTLTEAAYNVFDAKFADPSDNQLNIARLLAFLSEHFKLEELRSLAVLLGEDHENIEGTTKSGFARELIAHMKHRGRLWELIKTAFTME